MPKWDKTRNYYADLEISQNASSEDIKKQFRKLALKYHPDRNPGREAEVNSKFQLIQSANEILTDDTLKRQYDEARRTYVSRFPTSSGVKGNPWADIGKQYPAPPTRRQTNAGQGRPASGAQRYASFTNGMPSRAPRPPPREDPQSRRSTAEAWDNMRSGSTRRPPATPGRAPTSSTRDSKASESESANPRTAYQQQKAQASFGNRRSGYTPRSPVADEPPVTSKNYSTTRMHSNLFNVFNDSANEATPADPLAQFRDRFRETHGDERHSTPYHSPGGEKTTLYNDVPGLGRSASTRAPPRPEMPGAFPNPHQRSSSTPRSSSNDGGSEDSTKVNTGVGGSANRKMPNSRGAFQPRASDRQQPEPESNDVGQQPRPATATNPQTASAHTHTSSATNGSSTQADGGPSFFNFSGGSNIPGRDAGVNGLARSSADNINTKFVQDEHLNWKFTAGNAAASEPQTPTKSRPASRSRITRRNTPKRPAQTSRMPSTQESSEESTTQGFSAGEWNEKIGTQHFEPQRSNSASSTSPSRRTYSKKPNPVKMTAGSAGLVDEDESEEGQETPQRPSSGAVPMDIDSPPAEKADSTPKASQTNGARNIPVEPHRAEWRAGDLNGVHSKSTSPSLESDSAKEPFSGGASVPQASAPMPGMPFVPHNGGSEDTEEFRTTFADFKKVEPFADPTPTGLQDFADLKSTLPFESRPSEKIPLDIERPVQPLEFPTPPVAPRLPPTVVVPGIRPNNAQFRKYAQDFYQYMDKWEAFNNKILKHFTTRQENFKNPRQHSGSSFMWLDASGGDAAREYFNELEQDQAVRKQWMDAFEDHRVKVREFMAFRDQVR